MPQKPNTGRQAIVGRYFQGLPVVDATHPLRVVVSKWDIKRAIPKDMNNCVFAKACRRLFGSTRVLILRRHAYVELPDAKGRRVVNRFTISESTADKIIRFDKTKKADAGGFVFNAPSPSHALDNKEKYARKYRKSIKSGKHTIRAYKPNKKARREMVGVRDGRGKLGINYAF